MDKKQKKEFTKYVGFGLILGVCIGFGFGMIIIGSIYAPIFAGVGAGIGLVMGSIIGRAKIKIWKNYFFKRVNF